jgi:hypothetical protein
MKDQEKRKKRRSPKVRYDNFSKEALDALVYEFDRRRSVNGSKDVAGRKYPEFRALSYAQIRRLIWLHRHDGRRDVQEQVANGVNGNKNPFRASDDSELLALKLIGQMSDALDGKAFERVLEYGLHLMTRANK